MNGVRPSVGMVRRLVADGSTAPVWLHSDLQPGNLLLSGDRLTAVSHEGDPASQLEDAHFCHMSA